MKTPCTRSCSRAPSCVHTVACEMQRQTWMSSRGLLLRYEIYQSHVYTLRGPSGSADSPIHTVSSLNLGRGVRRVGIHSIFVVFSGPRPLLVACKVPPDGRELREHIKGDLEVSSCLIDPELRGCCGRGSPHLYGHCLALQQPGGFQPTPAATDVRRSFWPFQDPDCSLRGRARGRTGLAVCD